MAYVVRITVMSLLMSMVCTSGLVNILDKKINAVRDAMESEIALLRHDMGHFSSQLAHLLHGTDGFSSKFQSVSQCGCEKAETGQTGDQFIFNQVIRKGFEYEKKSLKKYVERIHSYVNSTMKDVDRMNLSMTSYKEDISESKSHVKRIDDITVIQSREIHAIKQQMESVMTKLDSLNETFKRRLEGVERHISAVYGFDARINKLDTDFNRRLEGEKRETSALSNFEARINTLEAIIRAIKEQMESVTTKLDSLNETFKRRLGVERDVSTTRGHEAKMTTRGYEANINSFKALGSVSKHGKSIYVRPNRGTDYDSAAKVCLSIGGYLVAISSEEENAFIKRTFITTSHTIILLGGTDRQSEGNWYWSHSGDRIPLRNQGGFQKWAVTEPNNRDLNEDCVVMSPDGEWNDSSCQNNFEYVCESDLI